jgi:hypothetical protein
MNKSIAKIVFAALLTAAFGDDPKTAAPYEPSEGEEMSRLFNAI